MDSFIGWVGGKKQLRREIIKRFPADGVKRYVEVFGGAGWVLFGKEPHEKEIYNDVNSELVNLFRMVKRHPEALEQEISLTLNSREEFARQLAQRPDGLTELQRAARMYYLIRVSYGCKLNTYGMNQRNASVIKNLQAVHQRLKNMVIENKSFEEVIRQHDRKDTLFYCDPPYYKAERFYDIGGGSFGREQHVLLRDLLAGIEGRFVLSYNDDPFIWELCKGFSIEPIERSNNLGVVVGGKKTYKELIIKNF